MSSASARRTAALLVAIVLGTLFAALTATVAAGEIQQRSYEATSRDFLAGADRACHPTRSRP